MSSLTPNPKLLLDENVRRELFVFLKEKGFNVEVVAKGASDSEVASISKAEKQVFVTNDQDFAEYSKDEIFSVVWLRLPQNSAPMLLKSFEKLLKGKPNFPGKLIILHQKGWDKFELGEYQTLG